MIPRGGFDAFVTLVREALGARLRDDVVAESVRGDVATLTPDTLRTMAHRLAGNVVRLRQGRPALPWTAQRWREWVPVQVMAVRRSRSGKGKLGVDVVMKYLAGTPCPLVVTDWWSLSRCRFYAKGFGFSRSHREGRPAASVFVAPEQLVTLRFVGMVDPDASEGEPRVTKLRFASGAAVAGWNRAQLRRRGRVGFPCPAGFPVTFPCHACHVGYEQCPAATHRKTFTEGACRSCGRADALFDPESASLVCVTCTRFKAHHPNREVPRGDLECGQ